MSSLRLTCRIISASKGENDKEKKMLEKKNKILKFGIAFDEQESKSIPVNNFDKKMDVIFTQSRIII